MKGHHSRLSKSFWCSQTVFFGGFLLTNCFFPLRLRKCWWRSFDRNRWRNRVWPQKISFADICWHRVFSWTMVKHCRLQEDKDMINRLVLEEMGSCLANCKRNGKDEHIRNVCKRQEWWNMLCLLFGELVCVSTVKASLWEKAFAML